MHLRPTLKLGYLSFNLYKIALELTDVFPYVIVL